MPSTTAVALLGCFEGRRGLTKEPDILTGPELSGYPLLSDCGLPTNAQDRRVFAQSTGEVCT